MLSLSQRIFIAGGDFMGTGCKAIRRIVLVLGFMMVLGCAAAFNPRPMGEVHFMDRAQTKSDGNFRVTAAVLSAEETKAVFALPLYRRGIQPIWLEIANNGNYGYEDRSWHKHGKRDME